MNRIFRIIWSKSLNTWVIASELATRCGKGASVDKRVDATASVAELIAGGSWRLRLVTLAVLATLYAPVQAADRYWDVNGSGVGLGGTGTWNTAPGFWSDSSDGVSGPFTNPWNNAAPGGDNAIFGGTGGTVTLGAPITVHNLTFGTAYTLTWGHAYAGRDSADDRHRCRYHHDQFGSRWRGRADQSRRWHADPQRRQHL